MISEQATKCDIIPYLSCAGFHSNRNLESHRTAKINPVDSSHELRRKGQSLVPMVRRLAKA